MEIIARIDYFVLKNFTNTEKLIKLWLTDANNVQFVIEETASIKELICKYELFDKKLKPVDIEKRMCYAKFENQIYYFVKYIE